LSISTGAAPISTLGDLENRFLWWPQNRLMLPVVETVEEFPPETPL
jgi:hypothetical protein